MNFVTGAVMNTFELVISPGWSSTDSFELVQKQSLTVKLSDVRCVYVGKANACMCGCKGRYRYAKHWQEEGGKRRGYAVDDEDCSDREVKRVVALLLMHPQTKVEQGLSDEMNMWVEQGEKIYCAYFTPEKQS